jgi:hypothetical protein
VLLDKKEISLYIIRKEIPHQSVYYISLSLSTFYYILLLVRRLYTFEKVISLIGSLSGKQKRSDTTTRKSFSPSSSSSRAQQQRYISERQLYIDVMLGTSPATEYKR